MLTTRSTHRTTIVAALACALLVMAAPVAAAQPDLRPPSAQALEQAQKEQEEQELRSYTPGSSALNSTATPAVPGPPTWPVNPEPIGPPPVVEATDNGGLDWTTIGFGFGGSLLVVGSIAGVVLHSRRAARSHIAA